MALPFFIGVRVLRDPDDMAAGVRLQPAPTSGGLAVVAWGDNWEPIQVCQVSLSRVMCLIFHNIWCGRIATLHSFRWGCLEAAQDVDDRELTGQFAVSR